MRRYHGGTHHSQKNLFNNSILFYRRHSSPSYARSIAKEPAPDRCQGCEHAMPLLFLAAYLRWASTSLAKHFYVHQIPYFAPRWSSTEPMPPSFAFPIEIQIRHGNLPTFFPKSVQLEQGSFSPTSWSPLPLLLCDFELTIVRSWWAEAEEKEHTLFCHCSAA
jgi:hypothetical protein